MTCNNCAKPLVGAQRQSCSQRCNEIVHGRRLAQPLDERQCRMCAKPFQPATVNQHFCSPTEAERAKGYIKSHCARTFQQRAYRLRKGTGTTQVDAPLPKPFDCAQCGERCSPGDNVSDHASKFCSAECKGTWHRLHVVLPKARRKARRERVQAALDPAARGETAQRRWVEGPCPTCGKRATVRYSGPSVGYCSRVCKKRAAGRRANAKNGGGKHRHRARRYGVAYKPVSRAKVFERDNYVCGICRQPTDRDAQVPDPRAPTLDHIVPISKGGPHLYSNVQTACFECNWRKGDREDSPQLSFAA